MSNDEIEILIDRLWESDAASELTNQAARVLDKLLNENKRLKHRNSDMSWTLNPDTSGGAFTQDEIDRSRDGGWS